MPSDAVPAAVLELIAPGRLEEDLVGLDASLRARGLIAAPVLYRQLYRHQVDVGSAVLVAGRLPFIRVALQRRGAAMPEALDYLDAPEPVLGRRVWRSTLGAVAARLDERGEPVFIKPFGRTKRFTGRVVSEYADLTRLPVTGASAPVWCSEPVEFVSEHRVFLRHGEIVGVRHYDGDPAVIPSPEEIAAIRSGLRPRLPAGCALDLGVLADGRTVLVEGSRRAGRSWSRQTTPDGGVRRAVRSAVHVRHSGPPW